MSKPTRPHLAWTAAVILTVAALSVAAWWLWSGSGKDASSGGESAQAEDSGQTTAPGESAEAIADAGRQAAAEGADRAMEEGRFEDAAETLAEAEERFGWSELLGATGARLTLRESAFREALRPVEFRIESLVVGAEDQDAQLYARYTLDGVPVFASEFLELTTHEQTVDGSLGFGRSHVAVLRTSLARGVSLEILEPGGIFDSDEVLLGPIPLNPLPSTEGGRLDFADADSRVRSISVSYRPSPFQPGVHVDGRPPMPPVDATADQLFDALTSAIERDDLEIARLLNERLAAEHPAHPDLGFIAGRIQDRSDFLVQNRTAASFTIVELAVDPRPSGTDETTLWATGGEAPAFHASIRSTDDHVLAQATDGRTAPYLVPGDPKPAPVGNVLDVFAWGGAPLVLVVKDTSPRFSSRIVGDMDLPVNLSELPEGSGTIVVERLPRVLIEPGSEPNRIRRVVLRWTVTR